MKRLHASFNLETDLLGEWSNLKEESIRLDDDDLAVAAPTTV